MVAGYFSNPINSFKQILLRRSNKKGPEPSIFSPLSKWWIIPVLKWLQSPMGMTSSPTVLRKRRGCLVQEDFWGQKEEMIVFATWRTNVISPSKCHHCFCHTAVSLALTCRHFKYRMILSAWILCFFYASSYKNVSLPLFPFDFCSPSWQLLFIIHSLFSFLYESKNQLWGERRKGLSISSSLLRIYRAESAVTVLNVFPKQLWLH